MSRPAAQLARLLKGWRCYFPFWRSRDMTRISIRFLPLALFVACPIFAATFVVPDDLDLPSRADAIVIATAPETHAQLSADGGFQTVTFFTMSGLAIANTGP